MRIELKIRTAIVTAFMLLGMSSPAQAGLSVPGSGVWRFFGNCVDCGGQPVNASLTLQNYNQGTALSFENFVSFTYEGSILLHPYTVPGAAPNFNVVGLGGFLSNGGPQQVILIFGEDGYFQLNNPEPDSHWRTCHFACLLPEDVGNDGSFVLQAQTVPEPGTYALLGFGLAAIGFVSRRRHHAR